MARIQPRLAKAEAIRQEIDHLLSRPLSDEEWNDLVGERYVDEILRSRGARDSRVEEAAGLVRKRRRIYSTSREPKREKAPRMLSEQEAKQPTERSQVISILLALEASRDADVCLFRTEVLGDTLLSPKEVEAWIRQQAQKEGPPTRWLRIPLPQTKGDEVVKLMLGSTLETPHFLLEIPADQMRTASSLQVQVLQYTIPDDEWVRSVSISIGGVLERLQQLSEQLEKQYAWAQAQAVTFILTGHTPLISTLSSMLKRSSHARSNRIVLEIDPVVLPKVVTEYYRNLRKEMRARRHRNLSEKHMQLALFASRRTKSETWAEKMDEWNKNYQVEWRYKEVSNFAHDCLQAQRRLLKML
jgi:hypothetical protein